MRDPNINLGRRLDLFFFHDHDIDKTTSGYRERTKSQFCAGVSAAAQGIARYLVAGGHSAQAGRLTCRDARVAFFTLELKHSPGVAVPHP